MPERQLKGILTVSFEVWIADESGAPPSPEDMERIGDEVGDDISVRDDLELLDVATDAHDGSVSVTFQIPTTSISDLLEPTPDPHAVMRCALHAARVGTPGWEGKSVWTVKGIKSQGESSNVKDLQDA